MSDRSDFYVYLHRDLEGRPFYVGKGTGGRAWSRDRHPVWVRYVEERLKGQYEVLIVKDGLSEDEALDLEETIVTEYGEKLVNWINPGRQFDYPALERFHALRDANRRFVAETKVLEKVAGEEAVRRYREAIRNLSEYGHMVLERGLVAELAGMEDWGEVAILDRLTLCLVKLGRGAEAIAEAERYFEEFPRDRQTCLGKGIMKRVERVKAKLSRAS